MIDDVFAVTNVVASLVIALAAAYFFLAAGLGIRELRRAGLGLGHQATIGYGAPFAAADGADPAADWQLYFLVPCLNEATVIGATVAALRDPSGRARIIVVDDGSDDQTSPIAAAAGREQLILVRREPPAARQGKGAALNAGYRHLLDDVTRRGLDPERVLVCVMDADGRLSDGAVGEVLALFVDPAVGGVQLAVRIRNRNQNFWLRFQDHQFWNLSALTQLGRIRTGTVSLGGNGQFTRLSAMTELGEAPWSNALTEDLDLALSLAVKGWLLTSTPRAAVDQQGVASFRPLLRQRTRWYQGHMMAAARLPEVLRSTRIDNAAAIELALYLLVPWLLDLPWSILYHLILIEIGMRISTQGSGTDSTISAVVGTLIWYLLAFWPALVTAVIARRRDADMPWRRAMMLGHAFVVTNYLSYLCAWTALYRMARRQNAWAKTARVAESLDPDPSGLSLARHAGSEATVLSGAAGPPQGSGATLIAGLMPRQTTAFTAPEERLDARQV